MHSTDRAARVAGALYVLMGVVAPFSLIYVPGQLIVAGDAGATANKVRGSQMLFRLGIVAELIGAVVFVLLAMALYNLLSGVNRRHARLMVGLMLVSVAITFAAVLNSIAALVLFRSGGVDYLSVFDKPQRDALGMLFLYLHRQGQSVNEMFWGLWLLPFGLLVMRSGFLPRILGVLLIVNCWAYAAACLTSLLLPAYANAVSEASMPALLGEVWIMFWLLIKGAKVPPSVVAAC